MVPNNKERQAMKDHRANQEVDALLKRIGWHPSDWIQIEVYANMPPARKVAQMLRLRHEYVALLKARLRREHPGCSDVELAQLLQEHLALLSDEPMQEALIYAKMGNVIRTVEHDEHKEARQYE